MRGEMATSAAEETISYVELSVRLIHRFEPYARLEGYEPPSLPIGQVIDQVHAVAWVAALTMWMSDPERIGGVPAFKMTAREPVEYADREARNTVVLRAQYGSPLELVLVVGYAATAVHVAFIVAIHCLKRLYGLDLELRTHREDLWKKFARAKFEAQGRTLPGPLAQGDRRETDRDRVADRELGRNSGTRRSRPAR